MGLTLDLPLERRQEVIEHVRCKYGDDCVFRIVTFGTLAARGVIRDVNVYRICLMQWCGFPLRK